MAIEINMAKARDIVGRIETRLDAMKKTLIESQEILSELDVQYDCKSELDLPGTVIVPTQGAVKCQADLDAALADVADPALVAGLRVIIDYHHPIARAEWLDEHGMILRDKVAMAYSDPSAGYNLSALKAFASLKSLDLYTLDSSPHPIHARIPRSVWASLDAAGGDWTRYIVVAD